MVGKKPSGSGAEYPPMSPGEQTVVVPTVDQMMVSILGPPPPELDPYLDAASRCFARYGLFRTSVQDVSKEVGVNRTTVYRQVGGIDQMARLLFLREAHRMLEALLVLASERRGPDAVVTLVESLVVQTRSHPVIAKLLADEPEAVVTLVTQNASIANRLADIVAVVVGSAIDAGDLADRDRDVLAQWLVRIVLSLVIELPPGELRPFLAELLVPALRPEPT